MGTWTIYTAGADITMLQAILNGVAMICTQTSFIWGFAILASFWRLVSMSTSGTIAAVGGGSGSVMATGSMSAIVPLILAMLLTFPGAQCTVQVESTLTGNVTAIDNVPFIIAVVPAAGSQLGTNANAVVTTAFSAVNPSYDTISATGNGFLDPMRRLLGARTAIQRLNGLDSEIRTVTSACLTKESGVNYAEVNRLVVNAGNSGATAAQTVDINGASSTAIGALLYQAAQNLDGNVPDLTSPTMPLAILSCPDAVELVRGDINAALGSDEFARVSQGAVNGMDQPNPNAAYDLDQLTNEFTGLRKWTSVAGSLAGGTAQANTEVVNALFAEMVTSSLNCLQADGPDMAACQASMVQATEIERNNLQAAANEVPMLKYAGSFGSYLLALIIGLGPIIVMLMMFAGTNMKAALITVVHILVWPILVMNVGAELINAMISMQFSNFLGTLAHSGYLSQAVMLVAYKELSLQVGVGSHIMASLPVLMSMIFSLGATAALVSVASEASPKGTEVGQNQMPSAVAAAPLVRNTSPVTATQGAGFSDTQFAGGMDAVSASAQFGSMSSEASRTIAESETRTRTKSEGQTNVREWQKSFQTGDYSRFGITHSEGEAIRVATEENLRNSHQDSTGRNVSDSKQNSNHSSAEFGMSGNIGTSPSFSVGAGGKTQTAAQDAKTSTRTAATGDSKEVTSALSNTLSGEVGKRIERAHGNESSHTFRESQSSVRNYQDLLSKSDSETSSVQAVARVGNTLTGAFNKIGSAELAHQFGSNSRFQRFQLDAGRRRDADPSTQPYRERAESDMQNSSVDSVNGSAGARDAVIRTRAAVLQAGDSQASEDDRLGAIKYLAGTAQALTGLSVPSVSAQDVRKPGQSIADPVDRTGVASRENVSPTSRAAAPKAAPHVGRSNGGKPDATRPSESLVPSRVPPALTKPDGKDVTADVLDRFADADDSGIGANGHGTVIRTAANVVDNAVDTTRPAGSRSRVSFGKPAPAPAPKPERPRSPGRASGTKWR